MVLSSRIGIQGEMMKVARMLSRIDASAIFKFWSGDLYRSCTTYLTRSVH